LSECAVASAVLMGFCFYHNFWIWFWRLRVCGG
jgi:hypothetical protein